MTYPLTGTEFLAVIRRTPNRALDSVSDMQGLVEMLLDGDLIHVDEIEAHIAARDPVEAHEALERLARTLGCVVVPRADATEAA